MSDFQFYHVMFSTKLWSAAIVHRYSHEILERRDRVYHYTTGEGLEGIIGGRCLWATGAYYLNDSSEIDYGCVLAAEVLNEAVASAKFDCAKQVLRRAQDLLADSVRRDIRMATLYVSCFCESDNLLSQWRAYGRSGGFALGFGNDGLKRLSADGMTTSLHKVLYQKEDQVKRIRTLVDQAIAILRDDDVVRGNADNPTGDCVSYAGDDVAQVLLSVVTSFKSADFSEEQEWRLVCQPANADRAGKLDSVRRIVQLRPCSRGLVPYIRLASPPAPDPHSAFPIDSVRFGPTQSPDLARCATRLLLDRSGFESVNIVGSQISVILDR